MPPRLHLHGFTAILGLLFTLLGFFSRPRGAEAQTPGAVAPTVAPSQWASELDGLIRWVEAQRAGRQCTDRCFTLQRLRLTGSVDPGPMHFELEGSVLADGPVTIPLFGPPGHVRVEGVTEDGRVASVGFENDHYFAQSAARHFVLRGSITLVDEMSLNIPGPLNTFDADLSGARVVEGARLSGLSGITLHFDRGGATLATSPSPTVFQLSHSVRVAREVSFTYKLAMQSGQELGVVRLPLRFGERVLDVTGATGWRVQSSELLLPLGGRQAEVNITGTLSSLGEFSPDPRSEYEWWLIEGDPEHRLEINTDARQMDASESPIARTQPSARLFLLQRGQRLSARAQSLVSMETLAAVVHSHDRRVVLTRRADLVSDDTLAYENNGVDYLPFSPDGRPVFLSTDGAAERIMHRAHHPREIQIPLRTSRHTARVQSLSRGHIGLFGGRMEIPTPSQPLTASHVNLSLGLPRHVVPIVLMGGDRPVWSFDDADLGALGLAVFSAWIAFRTRTRKLLGAVTLSGLWVISPGIYALCLFALCVTAVFWLLGRFFRGPSLVGARILVGVMCFFLSLGAFGLVGSLRSSSRPEASVASLSDDETRTRSLGGEDHSEGSGEGLRGRRSHRGPASILNPQQLGNLFDNNNNETNALVAGVTPVAVTLPSSDRTVSARRELVTPQRPFRPVLYYLTGWAILPLGLAWLTCLLGLLRAHRTELTALSQKLRARIENGPVDQASSGV